jgi:hypothetical protein
MLRVTISRAATQHPQLVVISGTRLHNGLFVGALGDALVPEMLETAILFDLSAKISL